MILDIIATEEVAEVCIAFAILRLADKRHRNAFKTRTTGENADTDIGNTSRKDNFRKPCATIECISKNACAKGIFLEGYEAKPSAE